MMFEDLGYDHLGTYTLVVLWSRGKLHCCTPGLSCSRAWPGFGSIWAVVNCCWIQHLSASWEIFLIHRDRTPGSPWVWDSCPPCCWVSEPHHCSLLLNLMLEDCSPVLSTHPQPWICDLELSSSQHSCQLARFTILYIWSAGMDLVPLAPVHILSLGLLVSPDSWPDLVPKPSEVKDFSISLSQLGLKKWLTMTFSWIFPLGFVLVHFLHLFGQVGGVESLAVLLSVTLPSLPSYCSKLTREEIMKELN